MKLPTIFKRSFTTTLHLQFMNASKIRNIGIIAHIDAGKTTTTERMLYYSGITSRIGNVDQGDTITDFLPAERERGITIQSASITIPWNKHKINLIDTPGHADFEFEVIRSLKVLDGAVTILDAVAAVEAQTEKVWKQNTKIPKLIFVNKMDREGAGFSRTVKDIIATLRTRILLLNVPLWEELANREKKFIGVLDVVNMKALRWDSDDNICVTDLNSEQYDEISRCRESLIETLGEIDEAVVDSFLKVEDYMKVPADIINAAIRKSTIEKFAVPVLCGASFKNIGVQPLLDAVVSFLPNPLEIKPEVNVPVKLVKNEYVINDNNKLVVGLVFKVSMDPIRGIMNFIRIYSGKLHSNSSITVNGEVIRIGKLLIMNANLPEEVSELTAGNIGVIVSDKLKTGDTILSHVQKKKIQPKDQKVIVNPIVVPPPVFSISLEPRTPGDKRSMDDALKILLREDPSLKVTFDEETGQTLLSGMGELHLEIARDKLLDLKAKIETSKIMVSYKETILEKRTITKETPDGIKITVSVSPNPQDIALLPKGKQYTDLGDKNYFINDYEPKSWEFKVLPYSNLINGLVSGVISSIQRGPILKVPFHSTLVQVENIEIPNDFTNTIQIINLIRQAILEIAKDEHNFNVMEPIMRVTIDVSSDDMGNVIQDLTSQRKGNISSIDDENDSSNEEMIKFNNMAETQYLPADQTLGLLNKKESFSGMQMIHADVPLKEMVGYLPKLRSLTQGRSTFHMEVKGLNVVTNDRVEKIKEELLGY